MEEIVEEGTDQLEMKALEEMDPSMISFISDLPRITRQFSMYYESKMESSAFVDSLFHIPREFAKSRRKEREERTIFFLKRRTDDGYQHNRGHRIGEDLYS